MTALTSLFDISTGYWYFCRIYEFYNGIKNFWNYWVEKYKLIVKKKKKKNDEIAFLAKPNLNCIKGLISSYRIKLDLNLLFIKSVKAYYILLML